LASSSSQSPQILEIFETVSRTTIRPIFWDQDRRFRPSPDPDASRGKPREASASFRYIFAASSGEKYIEVSPVVAGDSGADLGQLVYGLCSQMGGVGFQQRRPDDSTVTVSVVAPASRLASSVITSTCNAMGPRTRRTEKEGPGNFPLQPASPRCVDA